VRGIRRHGGTRSYQPSYRATEASVKVQGEGNIAPTLSNVADLSA
jgi:hypothetical protein